MQVGHVSSAALSGSVLTTEADDGGVVAFWFWRQSWEKLEECKIFCADQTCRERLRPGGNKGRSV